MPDALLLEDGTGGYLLEDASGIVLDERTGYPRVVMADSPIGYFRLGESAGTAAANECGGASGSIANAPTLGVAGAVGDANTAITFASASSQYIDIDTGSIVYPTGAANRTTEAWVRTTTAAVSPIVVFGSGIPSERWAMEVESNDQLGVDLLGTSFSFGAAGALSDNGWHHVVATYDGANIRAYIDGAEASGSPQAATPNTVFANAWIGTNGSTFANASIDEVAIYDTPLSLALIAAHYNAFLHLIPHSSPMPQLLPQ